MPDHREAAYDALNKSVSYDDAIDTSHFEDDISPQFNSDYD